MDECYLNHCPRRSVCGERSMRGGPLETIFEAGELAMGQGEWHSVRGSAVLDDRLRGKEQRTCTWTHLSDVYPPMR